jgi:peptide/nickel transport system ATP-binding protein
MPVGTALTEPMKIHQLYGTETARRDRAINLLETVGLKPDHFNRLPHSFSGGQRQRICIARALAVEPRLLICDEIVSSLDVSVQATILNLLSDLQQQFGLTYLMISHDLNVIGQMCDRLLVMHDGKIETVGEPGAIFSNPETEYVKQLVSAVLD